MKFNFSIKQALKNSWSLFIKNPAVFVGLSVVMLALSYVSNRFQGPDANSVNIPFMIGLLLVSTLWSYVWQSVALAAIDNKSDSLKYTVLHKHLPSVRQFLTLVAIMLLGILAVMVAVFVGIVLLMIIATVQFLTVTPMTIVSIVFAVLGAVVMMYLGTRLMFISLVVIDRKGGVFQSVSYAWKLTRGAKFWTVFLVLIIAIVFTVAGLVAFGVGSLITYPLATLLIATLYRALTLHHEEQAIVLQPQEITAPDTATE